MYTCIHAYICAYIYICVCIHIYIYIYIYIMVQCRRGGTKMASAVHRGRRDIPHSGTQALKLSLGMGAAAQVAAAKRKGPTTEVTLPLSRSPRNCWVSAIIVISASDNRFIWLPGFNMANIEHVLNALLLLVNSTHDLFVWS